MITKQQLVDMSPSMVVPTDRLPEHLKVADADRSGLVQGAQELGALADLAGADVGQLAGVIRQAPGRTGQPLGDRRLKDVPELKWVYEGIGTIAPARGATMGTRAIQEALAVISQRLPDLHRCDPGAPDENYGPGTQRAVTNFQAAHPDLLQATGVVDGATLKQLDVVLARARTLRVNPANPPQPGQMRGIFGAENFKGRCVLTFDDGPDPDTRIVLAALREVGVKGATFFVQGKNVDAYPEILREIVADGHVIGNHTYSHPDLSKMKKGAITEELERCQQAVNRALGREYRMTQVRPPYGATNADAKAVIAESGMAYCFWHCDSNDWRPENRRNHQGTLDNVFAGGAPITRKGGIILFHDIHPSTGEVLPQILRKLQELGIQFTTIQALLDEKYNPAVA